METNVVFTNSKGIRLLFLVLLLVVLALGLYQAFLAEFKLYKLLFYIPIALVSYAITFSRFIVTDNALIVKGGLGSKEIIPLAHITSISPQGKGFSINYTRGNGKKGFRIFKYVDNVDQFYSLLQKRCSLSV